MGTGRFTNERHVPISVDNGILKIPHINAFNDAELDEAQATCVQATAPMGSVLFFTEVRPFPPPPSRIPPLQQQP